MFAAHLLQRENIAQKAKRTDGRRRLLMRRGGSGGGGNGTKARGVYHEARAADHIAGGSVKQSPQELGRQATITRTVWW